MKKFLMFLCVAMFVIGIAGGANATVLTFDDIGVGGAIYDGYGGLNWDNMYYLDATNYSYNPSGYENGLVSGDYVAYNGWGNMAVVSDSVFDFNGTYLTGAWNNGLNIMVTGYLNGVETYTQTVVVDTTAPTWFDFSYYNIDSLSFQSWGGTYAGYTGYGTQFAMDNFTFNESAPVPEPATILLMGAGLIGLVGYSRKRSSKKS